MRDIITGLRQAAIVFAGSFVVQTMQSTVEMNVGTISMASAVIVLGVVGLVGGWTTMMRAVSKERDRDADRTRQRIEEHRARLRRLYRDARHAGRWTAGNAQEWQSCQAEIRALMGDLKSRERAISSDSIDDMLPPELHLAPRAGTTQLRAEVPTVGIHEPERQARHAAAGPVARVSGLLMVALMGVTSSHGVGRMVQGEDPSLAMVRSIWDIGDRGGGVAMAPPDTVEASLAATPLALERPVHSATAVARAQPTDTPSSTRASSPTHVAMLAPTSTAEPTRVAMVSDGGAMATGAPPSEVAASPPLPLEPPLAGGGCDDGLELLEPAFEATIEGRVRFRWAPDPEVTGPFRLTACVDGTDDCTDLETVEPFLDWCPDRGANTYRWHVTSATSNHEHWCAEGLFTWRESSCP